MGAFNTFCSYCGSPFGHVLVFPRTCPDCSSVTWSNPLPVGVAIIPIAETGGVLLIQRSIFPLGPALPGGFMETGRGWRENVVREIVEETGLIIEASTVSLFRSPVVDTLFDTPNGNMVIFTCVPSVTLRDVETAFKPNDEVSGWSVGKIGHTLIFPAHQAVMEAFLREKGVM